MIFWYLVGMRKGRLFHTARRQLLNQLFLVYLSFIIITVRTVKEDGSECQPGEVGRLLLKLPLPPGFTSSLWCADDAFKKVYFEAYPVRLLVS